MTDMDEDALIQAAKQGDLPAFNRLVLDYQDSAYNVAYRMLGDPGLAGDAAQDSFIKAYRKLSGFRGGSFQAWLLRIVTNTCYDELRRQQRRPTVPLMPMTDEGEEIESPSWLVDESDSPEEVVMRTELVAAIQSCLEKLSPEFRAVVVLVDVEGLEYAQAAEALDRPLGTVKSRLARARLQMQECLQGFGELLPGVFRLKEEGSP